MLLLLAHQERTLAIDGVHIRVSPCFTYTIFAFEELNGSCLNKQYAGG